MENQSSEVALPELHGNDSDKLVASDVWRVVVRNQLVDRTSGDVVSAEEVAGYRFVALWFVLWVALIKSFKFKYKFSN